MSVLYSELRYTYRLLRLPLQGPPMVASLRRTSDSEPMDLRDKQDNRKVVAGRFLRRRCLSASRVICGLGLEVLRME